MADERGWDCGVKGKNYVKELNRLVGDKDTYKKLVGNLGNPGTLKQAQIKGIVTKKDARYLFPKPPRLPVISASTHLLFYLLNLSTHV